MACMPPAILFFGRVFLKSEVGDQKQVLSHLIRFQELQVQGWGWLLPGSGEKCHFWGVKWWDRFEIHIERFVFCPKSHVLDLKV